MLYSSNLVSSHDYLQSISVAKNYTHETKIPNTQHKQNETRKVAFTLNYIDEIFRSWYYK